MSAVGTCRGAVADCSPTSGNRSANGSATPFSTGKAANLPQASVLGERWPMARASAAETNGAAWATAAFRAAVSEVSAGAASAHATHRTAAPDAASAAGSCQPGLDSPREIPWTTPKRTLPGSRRSSRGSNPSRQEARRRDARTRTRRAHRAVMVDSGEQGESFAVGIETAASQAPKPGGTGKPVPIRLGGEGAAENGVGESPFQPRAGYFTGAGFYRCKRKSRPAGDRNFQESSASA
jgi:hypothetical protein